MMERYSGLEEFILDEISIQWYLLYYIIYLFMIFLFIGLC